MDGGDGVLVSILWPSLATHALRSCEALASVPPLPPASLRSVLPLGNLLGRGLPVILYGVQTFLAERNKF